MGARLGKGEGEGKSTGELTGVEPELPRNKYNTRVEVEVKVKVLDE